MQLSKARIKNFKALRDTTVPLSNFTVLLGSNGSGKSSVLQALHWAIQSARNPKVETNKAESGSGSTLSQNEADYIPSPDYKNASHDKPYGNFRDAPRMDVELDATSPDGSTIFASIWLKAARNEGTTVHAPSNNALVASIRDRQREFSTYIPGLAGIPLQEEKRSARIVHRQAAAGDANTVLRNLLLLLQDTNSELGRSSALKDVEYFASQVMGQFALQLSFDENADFSISASFQTGAMQKQDPRLWKPLELAGIGFLQVLQIFAYLVYYRPRLFLVDEPDSHLHPDRQEKLVEVLRTAADTVNAQVVLATHSPSVVRALGAEASIVWMQDGAVTANETEARKQMGWGLLDKKVLLLSEDKQVAPLKRIIRQWPEIDRRVAVWPLSGVTTLPAAESLAGMRTLFGDSLQLVLHRDGDFMSQSERSVWEKPYLDKGIFTWVTPNSDVEACFLEPAVIAATLQISKEDATSLLSQAISKRELACAKRFSEKRAEHRGNKKLRATGDAIPSDSDVKAELLNASLLGASLGKDLLGKLRDLLEHEYPESRMLGKICPSNAQVAPSLKIVLDKALGFRVKGKRKRRPLRKSPSPFARDS